MLRRAGSEVRLRGPAGPVPCLFRPIAAHPHRTPLAGARARSVEESPATGVVRHTFNRAQVPSASPAATRASTCAPTARAPSASEPSIAPSGQNRTRTSAHCAARVSSVATASGRGARSWLAWSPSRNASRSLTRRARSSELEDGCCRKPLRPAQAGHPSGSVSSSVPASMSSEFTNRRTSSRPPAGGVLSVLGSVSATTNANPRCADAGCG